MENKEKTLEQLEAARLKVQQYEHKIQLLQNRQKHLEKKADRQRTHHLCTRMGYIEHCVPKLKELTEPDFYDLFDTLLNLPDVKKLIEEALHSHSGEGGV